MIIMIFNLFGLNKSNERIITSNKLSNNFDCLITYGVGPDVARAD
jgi:hypothetical protein